MDVAYEIVLGADRMSRSDLRAMIISKKLNLEEVRKETEKYIRETFTDGEEKAELKGLDYWFKPYGDTVVRDLVAVYDVIGDGELKETYDKMIGDAELVRITPMKEVLSRDVIARIRRTVAPEKKQCFKNAARLVTHGILPGCEYVEGRMTIEGDLAINHAWNRFDGNTYIDITRELALGEEPSGEYVMFGSYSVEKLLDIMIRSRFYGHVYEFDTKNQLKNRRKGK